MSLLRLQDITLSFTDNGNDTLRLLDRLTLEVPVARVTALVGGNGTGKTTLFNIISGFQPPDHGTIHYQNRAITRRPPHVIARLGIGRLFQGRQLFPDLTLLENMKIAAPDTTGEFPFTHLLRPRALARAEQQKEEQARHLLDTLFGPGNKYQQMLHSPAAALSYGEQRLIALVRLLMATNLAPASANPSANSNIPHLLLLDEPTSGVNPVYIATIHRIIRRMVSEHHCTVLMIEHNMPFVRDTADHCAYLAEGRIQAEGTPAQVLDSPEVKASYLGLFPEKQAPA
jgi:ABC-type branched-subunit amino acid transport system ATPase component